MGVISTLLGKELKPVGSSPVLPLGRFFPLLSASAPSTGFCSSLGALADVAFSFRFCLSVLEVLFALFIFPLCSQFLFSFGVSFVFSLIPICCFVIFDFPATIGVGVGARCGEMNYPPCILPGRRIKLN